MMLKILKLAKRLNKLTFKEVALISECEADTLENLLDVLEREKRIKKSGEVYLYIPPKNFAQNRLQLPQKFQHHKKETIDMIIKCFCADINTDKTAKILEPQKSCIHNFNKFFREIIFKTQEEQLQKHFFNNPKIACKRTFFDKTVYFYFYDNRLFISAKKLKDKNEKRHSDDYIKKLKIIYSRIKRQLDKCSYKKYIHLHVAEQVWRNEKSFNDLYFELKSILKI